uniref:Stress-associated endoplasmic reticulum protein n=1 Tax=Daucus carota subsp. sativus TaxID=79200 RepID=A0A175YHX6_DAUCS
MTTSKRLAERKIAKFEKNISRKGSSANSWKKKLTAENIALALFASVIIGSFVYQIIKLAMNAE